MKRLLIIALSDLKINSIYYISILFYIRSIHYVDITERMDSPVLSVSSNYIKKKNDSLSASFFVSQVQRRIKSKDNAIAKKLFLKNSMSAPSSALKISFVISLVRFFEQVSLRVKQKITEICIKKWIISSHYWRGYSYQFVFTLEAAISHTVRVEHNS